MERTLLIETETIEGKVTVDLPSRSERLKLLKELGEIGPDEVIKLSSELEKRIKKIDLKVDPSEYSGLCQMKDPVEINSFEALDNSPIADEVMNYLVSILVSGKLGNLKESLSDQKREAS